jgi:hypothetical protein
MALGSASADSTMGISGTDQHDVPKIYQPMTHYNPAFIKLVAPYYPMTLYLQLVAVPRM